MPRKKVNPTLQVGLSEYLVRHNGWAEGHDAGSLTIIATKFDEGTFGYDAGHRTEFPSLEITWQHPNPLLGAPVRRYTSISWGDFEQFLIDLIGALT